MNVHSQEGKAERAIVRLYVSVNPSLLRTTVKVTPRVWFIPTRKGVDGDPGQVELPVSEVIPERNIALSASASICCRCRYTYTY